MNIQKEIPADFLCVHTTIPRENLLENKHLQRAKRSYNEPIPVPVFSHFLSEIHALEAGRN